MNWTKGYDNPTKNSFVSRFDNLRSKYGIKWHYSDGRRSSPVFNNFVQKSNIMDLKLGM